VAFDGEGLVFGIPLEDWEMPLTVCNSSGIVVQRLDGLKGTGL
jgi:hypothetical protein